MMELFANTVKVYQTLFLQKRLSMDNSQGAKYFVSITVTWIKTCFKLSQKEITCRHTA